MSAPVALFVYNRPDHTKRTINALAGNYFASETILYIFSDGPTPNALPDEIKKIETVRQLIGNERRFKKINIIESSVNKGLASSVISGITHVLQEYDTIIVLEDDILASKHFLKYCNESLDRYQSENRVMAVSSYTFPAGKNLPDTFFLSTFACWGWATWKDRWQLFNSDSGMLLNEIMNGDKISEFNFNNSYDHFGLLKSQFEGKIDSWAVRWQASIFLNNGLVLYPSRSLTQNVGMDGSGTHYTVKNNRAPFPPGYLNDINMKNLIFNFPETISTDPYIQKKIESYLKKDQKPTLMELIKGKLSMLKNQIRVIN